MKRILYLFILMFCCGHPVQAKEAEDGMFFHTVDLSNMADRFVQQIVQDKDGFMWFSTLNGLCRYDGYNIRNYSLEPLGVGNNGLRTMLDGNGVLWIATQGGLFFYNKAEDTIDRHIGKILEPFGISEAPQNIYVDEDKSLWCHLKSMLVRIRFDASHDGYEVDRIHLSELTSNENIISLVCRGGEGYAMTDDGTVWEIDWGNKRLSRMYGTVQHPGWNHQLFVDMNGRLWDFVPHTQQLHIYDIRSRQSVALPDEIAKGNYLFTDVAADSRGNVWMSTDNAGVIRWTVKTNKVEMISRQYPQYASLPTNHIRCLFVGKGNILWLGTTKAGAAYTKLSGSVFLKKDDSFVMDVKGIFETRDGARWLCLDGEGLARQQGATHTVYSKRQGNAPSDIFLVGLQRKNGEILLGSYGSGVLTLDKTGIVPWAPVANSAVPLRYVNSIVEDAYANIWVGTFMNGLHCISPQGDIRSFDSENSAIETNSITDIWCKNGNNIYIATGYGVYMADVRKKEITAIHHQGEDLLKKTYVGCLWKDSRGLLWMGTRKGVYIYDAQNDELTHLTTADGLSNNNVIGMTEDREHHLWLSTNYGVTCVGVNKGKFTCIPFHSANGISLSSQNSKSIFTLSDGYLYLGMVDGYVRIDPSAAWKNQWHSKVVFTDIYIPGKQQYRQPNGDVSLSHDNNTFSIDVSCMSYGEEYHVNYMYKVNSEDWILLSGNRINFNQLAPGHYTISVKTAGADEKNVSRLNVTIRNPWWWSRMARLFYLLLAGCAMYLLIRQTKAKARRRMEEQQRQILATRKHEMDEAKLNFFTHISHDLRTPLSLILIPIDRMMGMKLPENIRSQIEMVQRNTKILQNEVNQLLDFKKLDEHLATLNVTNGDFAFFVRDTCKAFLPVAAQEHITMDINIPDEPVMMAFDQNKMQRVILNLLSNAVKYNVKNGSVSVSLDTIGISDNATPSKVRLRVADSGKGIKDENKSRVFQRFFQEHANNTTYIGNGLGLFIVQEYVNMHEGTVTVQDNQPQGTVFVVDLPIRTAEQSLIQPHSDKEQPEKESMKAQVSPKKETTLLIVEDNGDMRHFLRDCLEEDYHILDAANGEEAIELLRTEDVQLVVSDVMMPVMDGMQLVQHIKTDIELSHIPVILLTAKTAETSMIEGLREGADDYIAKPFNLEVLKLKIGKMLAWSQQSRERFRRMDVSPKDITISSLDEQLVTKAIAVVEDNMDNVDFTVEELSAAVGMTRGHLYKKLMSITGMAPLEFIRTLRVKRGRQLLEESGMNVSQVAWEVGLTPKRFSKYFKEEYGCLPSEYKK